MNLRQTQHLVAHRVVWGNMRVYAYSRERRTCEITAYDYHAEMVNGKPTPSSATAAQPKI
jgi:hypothetical protein